MEMEERIKPSLGVGFIFYDYYGNLSEIIDETSREYIVQNKHTLGCWTQLKHRMKHHLSKGSYRYLTNYQEPIRENDKYLACIL